MTSYEYSRNGRAFSLTSQALVEDTMYLGTAEEFRDSTTLIQKHSN